ncbi:complement factor H-related protein 5-like [Rhynchocyon petersi]
MKLAYYSHGAYPEHVKSCGPPPQLSNGQVKEETKEYAHSDVVEYDCNPKFLLKGSKKIQCVDGEWTTLPVCVERTKPLCPPPPLIPNSQDMTTTVNYQDGEKFSILCQKNYIIQGKDELVCKDAKWQPAMSSTNSYRQGAFSPVLDSYQHGEEVTYSCTEDFGIDGPETVKCFGGKWPTLPECKSNSEGKCGCPLPVENGDTTSISLTEYAKGSSVEYQCQSYYVLEGSRFITCREGQWSQPPKCLPNQGL